MTVISPKEFFKWWNPFCLSVWMEWRDRKNGFRRTVHWRGKKFNYRGKA